MHIRTQTGAVIIGIASALICLVLFLLVEHTNIFSGPRMKPDVPDVSVDEDIVLQAIHSSQQEHVDPLPSSLMENGYLYSNSDYGFSITLPKTTLSWNGDCIEEGQNGASTTTLLTVAVPVKVYERADGISIEKEYFYRIDQNNNCIRIKNETYEDPYEPSWKIVTKTIESDDDMNAWLQERYGKGCSVGSYKPTEQDGLYDVVIEGDGKDLGETDCPINYITIVKYAPEKQRSFSWHIGQDISFPSNVTSGDAYDFQITDSFRVE